MRTRFAVLAVVASALVAVAAPWTATAAPHHNKGLTINATPNPINSGDGVLIYGQLNGSNNSGQMIRLYHRVNPRTHFTLIQTTTTNSLGFYEFARAEGVVLTNRSWFVRGPHETHSRTVHERVAALVSLAASSTTGTTNHPIVFTGHVSPSHPFEHVYIQEQGSVNGNAWHTIARGFTGGNSNFSIPHKFRIPGDYTLRAVFRTDVRNIHGESDSITVSIQQAQHPSFTINSSSPIITEGQPVMITGTLFAGGSATTPQPSTEVTLWGKQAGTPWIALATTTTGTDGSYSFPQAPVHNTVYRVKVTLNPNRTTALLYEGVQDVVTISSSSSTATVGGTVTLSGTVSPDKTGHTIYLQRLGSDGFWHNVQSGTVTTGSTYSFKYTFGKMGTHQLRARIYGGPENIGAASPAVAITVTGVAPVASLPPAS